MRPIQYRQANICLKQNSIPMRRISTLLLLWVCLIFYSPAFTQSNKAIKFDGTTTYVTTSANSLIGFNPNAFTVEFWAYVPVLATDGPHEFMSQGSLGSFAFYIGYDGANGGHLQAGDTWTDVGIAMPAAQWVHLALAFDAVQDTAAFYVNGVEVADLNGYFILNGSGNFQMGAQTDGTGLLNGTMDQVKVWNTVRTTAQIKGDMYGTIDVSSPDLEAYYAMDEGTSTTVGNTSTISGLNGTLVGAPSAAWVSSPVQYSAGNGISLDGTGAPSTYSQVAIANPGGLYDISAGTVEFWVYPSSLPGTSTVLANRGAGGVRYSFDITSSSIQVTNGSGSHSIPYSFITGDWYHLAFVNDGTQSTVYVNGVNTGTITGGFGGSVTGQPLTIGVAKNSGTDIQPFTGAVDEVRIWSSQRTQTEINTSMGTSLTGAETNLLGLFSFNQGLTDGNNTGLITAVDNTPFSNHGTLTNFALSGANSNFIISNLIAGPGSLPVILDKFTATRQGNQALLRWQTEQEQNSRDFDIERSPDGISFTTIGSVPAAGNSNSTLQYSFTDPAPDSKDYYRLRQVDLDGKFTFSSVRLLTFPPAAGKLVWYPTGNRSVEVYWLQGNEERYTLTDMNGRILREGQLSAGKAAISGYPSGLYIVNVITASGQMATVRILLP
jgi:hypothetical protein